MKFRDIPLFLLAKLTRHPRYRPEIQWSSKSWTHNIFRVYELIFGRRFGIKAEMTTSFDGVTLTCQAHSFEAMCALLETSIRNLARWRFPYKIWIPVLSSSVGLPIPASPYLFAIAYDNSVQDTFYTGSPTSTLSWSHTCTGSNLLLLVSFISSNTIYAPATFTYNSTSTTNITGNMDGNGYVYQMDYLIAPSTGSNTVAASLHSSEFVVGISTSYSGVSQSSPIDSYNTGTINGNKVLTVNTTVVHSNCWLVGFSETQISSSSSDTESTNVTNRQTGNLFSGNFTFSFGDSNGTVGTGSQGITFTVSGATGVANHNGIVASIAVSGTAWVETYTESTTMTDTVIRSTVRILKETATMTDTVIRAIGRFFTESTVITDVIQASRIKVSTLLESIAMSDVFSRSISRILTESIAMTDKIARSTVRFFSESTVITDIFSRIGNFYRTFTESTIISNVIIKRYNGILVIWNKRTKPIYNWFKRNKPTFNWIKRNRP